MAQQEKMSEKFLDKWLTYNSLKSIIADSIYLKTPTGKEVPIYFTDEAYMTQKDELRKLKSNENQFLKELYDIKRNRKEEYGIDGEIAISAWGDDDWKKNDDLRIPYNYKDSTDIDIILKNKSSEIDLRKILFKCNMSGSYVTHNADVYSYRTYPFVILQQYKRNNKDIITIIAMRYFTYSDQELSNYIFIYGKTLYNTPEVQKILSNKLGRKIDET